MGAGRAFHPVGQTRRAPAHGGGARGAERPPPRAGHGLPVACPAQGPAAEEHGAGYLVLWAWDGTLGCLEEVLEALSSWWTANESTAAMAPVARSIGQHGRCR